MWTHVIEEILKPLLKEPDWKEELADIVVKAHEERECLFQEIVRASTPNGHLRFKKVQELVDKSYKKLLTLIDSRESGRMASPNSRTHSALGCNSRPSVPKDSEGGKG